MFFKISRSR